MENLINFLASWLLAGVAGAVGYQLGVMDERKRRLEK